MILKKPYAFLIKFFKAIHIVMFLSFSYLAFVLRNIYLFFSRYVKNGTFTYFNNMKGMYTSIFIIILIIILLIINTFIYLLMQKKEKPILFYKILFGYLVILLIFLIYFRNFFASLDLKTYDSLIIIIYRDISLFLYIINYFYVGFSFIRGFGFDIKKFSFERDKKELMLEETDNEEYEVNILVDKDNIKNYFRRERREFRYYLRENAKILIIFLLILIISLGGYFSYQYFVYDRVYKENDLLEINGNNFQIQRIYWTNKDKYGDEIKNSYFVVVNMKINSSIDKLNFDKEKFRLFLNNKYYYHQNNYCDLFSDLGICYNNENITSNRNYLLVFKVLDNASSGYLEILADKNNYYFKRIAIQKENLNEEIKNVKLNEEIIINNNNLKVLNYELVRKTFYNYEECQDKCMTYLKVITPNLNDCVLILNANFSEYQEDFWNNYVGVKYTLNNKEYYLSGRKVQFLDYYNNKVYLSVSEDLLNATKISLIFKLRNIEYDVELR